MPWGKNVFYPRMLHKARPQKVSDFLVGDERWYVSVRAEMGVMPWGKHGFYPRMLHKARPQKVSDFLVGDERWYVSVRDVYKRQEEYISWF